MRYSVAKFTTANLLTFWEKTEILMTLGKSNTFEKIDRTVKFALRLNLENYI